MRHIFRTISTSSTENKTLGYTILRYLNTQIASRLAEIEAIRAVNLDATLMRKVNLLVGDPVLHRNSGTHLSFQKISSLSLFSWPY